MAIPTTVRHSFLPSDSFSSRATEDPSRTQKLYICRNKWFKYKTCFLPEDSSGIFWLHQSSLIKNRPRCLGQGRRLIFDLSSFHPSSFACLRPALPWSNQARLLFSNNEMMPNDAWDGSMPPKPSIIPPMFSILPNSCDPSWFFCCFHQLFPQATSQQPRWKTLATFIIFILARYEKTNMNLKLCQ